MKTRIDFTKLCIADKIQGDEPSETVLLNKLLNDATQYIHSFSWCQPIAKAYLGYGVGEVIGVFLFEFEVPVKESDKWLWVVVSDVPSAYYVIDDAPDPSSALKIYCSLMDDWVDAVMTGQLNEDIFPVRAEPTVENAELLRRRIQFIRSELIQKFDCN